MTKINKIEYNREYWKKNKKKIAKARRIRYLKYHEEMLEYQREYRRKNRKKILAAKKSKELNK